MIKIFCVGRSTGYASWMQGELVPKMEDADLVLFTGGTDVNPALYGEPRHPRTDSPDRERDDFEVECFRKAKALDKHLIGICRGAQFLCVMAGGKLIQHQDNNGGHFIHSELGQYSVTSDHHQAQYPWVLPKGYFKVLGWTLGLSAMHQDGRNCEMVNGCDFMSPYGWGRHNGSLIEVEDAYYPKIKALCIQSHPEWMYPPEGPNEIKSIAHYQKLLELHLSDQL